MSARNSLIYSYAPVYAEGHRARFEELLDAVETEARAERDAEIMRWLGKKAHEYRATGHVKDALRADTCTQLASKISRGAVRQNNTLLPAGVKPLFFEPGRTYVREHHGDRIEFYVASVGIAPDCAKYTAFGWRRYVGQEWEPTDSDDFTGWTDVAEEVAR